MCLVKLCLPRDERFASLLNFCTRRTCLPRVLRADLERNRGATQGKKALSIFDQTAKFFREGHNICIASGV
jgi:hypothetical protein